MGRERFAVLCRMLLIIVFQRARGLDERTGQVRRRMTLGGGYKLMAAVGSRPKHFKVEIRV